MNLGVPFTRHQCVSLDGTQVNWISIGDSEAKRTMVLVPALGSPPSVYRPWIEKLQHDTRFVFWFARGTYGSTAHDFAVERQLEDLDAVLRAAQVTRYIMGGWSMGVHLTLWHALQYPDAVQAMVLVAGPHGRLLHAHGDAMAHILRGGVSLWQKFGAHGHRAMLALLNRPELATRLFLGSGFVRRNPEFFFEIARDFAQQPAGVLAATVRALDQHELPGSLSNLTVPALVAVGSHDILTPPKLGRALATELPNAQLFEVHNASHYLPVEQPEALTHAIESFLQQR